jgi:hypothetical protein
MGVGGTTGTDAGVDAAPATLTQIWNAVLGNAGAEPAPGCRTCHDGSDSSIPNYTTVATSFMTLVNVASTSCSGTRVVPGNPGTSVLVNKLRAGSGFGGQVCGGNPMPRGARAITLAQLNMIESWVSAGALNN